MRADRTQTSTGSRVRAEPALACLVRVLSGFFALCVGCGDPALREGVYACAPGEPGTCPEGWFCRSDDAGEGARCYRTPAPGADAAVDGRVDASPQTCSPGVPFCQAQQVWSCTANGQPGEVLEICEPPASCLNAACIHPCDVVAQRRSNLGCDFWATSTTNSGLSPAFHANFGLAVYNNNYQPTTVTVTHAGVQVAEETIEAHQLTHLTLPYIQSLMLMMGSWESVLVPAGAYHLTSTLPVAVYQFNPLDYEFGGTYSYSNDASLLLPTHALSRNHIVMSRQTFGVYSGIGQFSFTPGFLAVVGVEDNTTVSVTLSASTMAGPGVPAGLPGAVQAYTLDAGEVLQIVSAVPATCTGTVANDDCNGMGGSCSYCDMGRQYDLTGTIVTSSSPVALFAGHDCSFVPYYNWSCDHLEEQIYPQETWGTEFVVARTEPQAQVGYSDEPNVIRILSGSNGNLINFTPAQQAVGSQILLNKGEWVEFEAQTDFAVSADRGILIGQFLVGANRYSLHDPANPHWGDPAFSLVVPLEQFRTSLTFLAPSTFPYNYVNITKLVGAGSPPVYLNGTPVEESAFSWEVGFTGHGVARVAISGTSHTIESSNPIGVTVYGFAYYTSYSYPGGLNLEYINPVD